MWIVLWYSGSDTNLHGYAYSNMVGYVDRRRNTIGHIFTIGGTTVSLILQLQKLVDFSTTKAKDVAAIEAIKEMIWL